MKANYDCVVMGGGPAGSTAAALVAQAGYSTLLVEREAMPRFHVGESLMPETYWTFQRLGVLDRMKNSEFVKKHSVQFVSASGKESQPFFFEDHDPGENSQTWQVERADFDKMLFDNAAEKGADCFDQTRVLEVLFDGQRSVGVRLQNSQGETRDVTARVVVDATGQQALIANRLGLCERLPHLKKAAIWTYYENARRDPDRNAGATIIFHTKTKEAWFWFIPLSRNITSIGVVGDHEFILKGRGAPEQVFAEELQNCAALTERLQDARQVDGFRVAKEFSYRTRQHAGDGWVLIGDAFGFIDPIYSSGVFFALKTGEMAADAIVEGFQTGDLSATQLGKWTNEFKQGAQWILKLVGAYYTNEFSFGQFMKSYPGHEGNLTDLLIGRIFHNGAGKIFDDMELALRDACS
jgi:flavin-dependent dehydrogenase